LAIDADGSYLNGGSAFWIVRKAADIPENFAYMVTAKHILQKIKDKGFAHVHVRVNLRDGGLKWI
jgi:ribosomal protein S11